jgi:hypothetical protein
VVSTGSVSLPVGALAEVSVAVPPVGSPEELCVPVSLVTVSLVTSDVGVEFVVVVVVVSLPLSPQPS